MNSEVIKVMNKKETKANEIKVWWEDNSYKVMRVVLFPIYGACIAKEKINNKLNAKEEWNEERVNEILNYYIPRRAEWCKEDKVFFFFDNGYGWSMCYAKRYLKRRDRRFWKVHNDWCGGKIRQYLIDKFELEGFNKTVLDTSNGRVEVEFKLIENVE